MASIFAPSLFLGRYLSPLGELEPELISATAFRKGTGVVDLEVADVGLGVRGKDAGGEWKA